ncbi:hypothetical protein GCM10010294_53150 [Streptomyces griseoloalbus]|nr:hypothetical protein GCM10010294_53150 [Streptomyces griseoloalbus]
MTPNMGGVSHGGAALRSGVSAVEKGVHRELDTHADRLRYDHVLTCHSEPPLLGAHSPREQPGTDGFRPRSLIGGNRAGQKASEGTYVPHTSRSALHTSPTVARAFSASFIG